MLVFLIFFISECLHCIEYDKRNMIMDTVCGALRLRLRITQARQWVSRAFGFPHSGG